MAIYNIYTKKPIKKYQMAELYQILKTKSKYYDKNSFSTQQEYDQAVKVSTTVYVGNIRYDATQDSIRQLFQRAGKVKKIIMGINHQGIRCGFCFVVFQTHEEAQLAVQYISQNKLGQKIIRVDVDHGYKEGREKGRGHDGNQKRDDFKFKNNDRNRFNNRYERRDDNRREQRGDDRNFQRNYGRNYERNYDRNDRGDFGRQRYQRNRQYQLNQPEGDYQKQGGPRKMGKKQHQQKSQEEY